ncbi:MAG TPA: SDR family oxidoreductase [Chloroflexota bacterium]|nr:SDR family oxidoreductase [Chloroflexota bacterium]
MVDSSIEGRVAIVTGAASPIGLGRAMSLALVRAGARVAMVDVDRASLDRSVADARAIGGADCALAVVGDVTRPEDAERVVRETLRAMGGLHILLNNAGINPVIRGQEPGPLFGQIPIEDWTRTVAVNVNGPFFMARAAVRHLVAQGWGRIIGVTTSLDTMIRAAPYGPSKAAHEALMAVIAREVEGTGVTANVLIPGGATRTNMTRDRWADTMLDPEVMQAPAVWLASGNSDGVNGRRIIAELWDEELPIAERLAKAAAPIAWPQLGRAGAAARPS